MVLVAGCGSTGDVHHELRVGATGGGFDVLLPLPSHPGLAGAWAAGLRPPFGNATAAVEDGHLRLTGSGQASVEAFVVAAVRPDAAAWGALVVSGHADVVSLQYDAVAPDGCWREASLSATDIDGTAVLVGPDQAGC